MARFSRRFRLPCLRCLLTNGAVRALFPNAVKQKAVARRGPAGHGAPFHREIATRRVIHAGSGEDDVARFAIHMACRIAGVDHQLRVLDHGGVVDVAVVGDDDDSVGGS